MIGRIDIVFTAPPSAPAAEIIAEVCQHYWPRACFQDVEDEQAHPLDGDWNDVSFSSEFFIYRDAAAVDAWEKLGAVTENANTMLHFLIRNDKPHGDREVTCVCDARTGDIEKIISSIQLELGQIARS